MFRDTFFHCIDFLGFRPQRIKRIWPKPPVAVKIEPSPLVRQLVPEDARDRISQRFGAGRWGRRRSRPPEGMIVLASYGFRATTIQIVTDEALSFLLMRLEQEG